MKINHLTLSWSISRGRDTEGYNICRLDSRDTGTRYKCMGGGYDMIGTVFGDFLEAEHQIQLQAWTHKQAMEDAGYVTKGYKRLVNDHRGVVIKPDGAVSLDGACGIESMLRIAEAIGLDVEREYITKGRRRGETIGWFISIKEEA